MGLPLLQGQLAERFSLLARDGGLRNILPRVRPLLLVGCRARDHGASQSSKASRGGCRYGRCQERGRGIRIEGLIEPSQCQARRQQLLQLDRHGVYLRGLPRLHGLPTSQQEIAHDADFRQRFEQVPVFGD